MLPDLVLLLPPLVFAFPLLLSGFSRDPPLFFGLGLSFFEQFRDTGRTKNGNQRAKARVERRQESTPSDSHRHFILIRGGLAGRHLDVLPFGYLNGLFKKKILGELLFAIQLWFASVSLEPGTVAGLEYSICVVWRKDRGLARVSL